MKKEPEKSLRLGNEQLKKKLEQKTALLKRAKHDLKIEASLEKVSAVAMRMRKSEDLIAVCEAMYKELSTLGFTNIRNAQIALRYDAKQSYRICVYSDYEVVVMQEAPYKSSPIVEELFNELAKSKDAFYQKEFSGKKFKDWRKWRESLSPLKDSRDATATSMCFYLYSIGSGHLGISTFNTITKEQIAILQRFKNVFELSYQRYTDVALAEAQAREAQIELGLERVRARAMAMQKSDELSELVDTVFKELTKLDFALTWCIINIIDENTMSNTVWAANPDINKAPESYHMLFEDYPFHYAMMKGWKERQTKYVYTLGGQEKKIYDDYLFSETEFKKTPAAAQAASRAMEKYVVSFSFSNFGGLQTVGDVPLSDANLDILSRFGKVFDLTYTRFNDLKQAEAQARESQIQLSLERVRARTMAMQKSDELPETAYILYQQFKELGKDPVQITIGIVNETQGVIELSLTKEGNQMDRLFKAPIDEPIVMHKIYVAWKEQKKSLLIDISGQQLREYNNFRNSLSNIEFNNDTIEDRRVINIAFFSKGLISVSYTEPAPPETVQLLERFAGVFEQTYTRFLDLQKAEAQARESQIQLALERVRARTMAMHQSNELAETALLLFQQLQHLGLSFSRTGFYIWKKNADWVEGWTSNGALDEILPPLLLPFKEDEGHRGIYEASLKGEPIYEQVLDGEELKRHYQWLMSQPSAPNTLKKLNESEYVLLETQYKYAAIFKEGYLLLIAGTAQPDASGLLNRFAKVFEQTYTRFLDLQKAEAQARESQIQLALERVRARTMAMQQSDELKEAAALLFQQAKALGVPAYSCGYNIWEKDDKVFTSWMSTQDGSIINGIPNIPLTEDANFIRYGESKQNGEPFFVLELRGERMQEHYQYLKTIPAFKGYFDYAVSVGFDLPKTQIHYLANFSHGNLLFISLEPCPEFHDVFKRIAAVFEQTYTRFLDLQKAEAQARESQIQLAMERVRARTMAMQNSNELPEAANLLFQQVQTLGMPAWSAGYCIWDEDKRAITLWMSSEGVLQPPFRAPLTEDPSFIHFREAHERGETFFVDEIGGEELVRHYKYMRTLPVVGEILDSIIEAGHPLPIFQIFHLAYFSQGFLLFITYEPVPAAQDIFKRFGKVFEQTYTRFLDLQKAEAQAREAQIEAALERVRSRSMGMQKSDELKEVIQLVYEQFVHLNIHIEHTGFIIDYKARDDMHIWLADQHLVPSEVTIPYFDSPPNNSIKEAKEKGQDFFKYLLTFEEKNRFYRDLFKFVPDVPEESLEYYFNCPGLAGSGVLLDNIGLYIENFSGTPYSDEENATLMRFGKVFQQTYTRFLDLQKAEAQAREAKIEAALERVRSRTMAMQKSYELQETSSLLFQQLKELGETAMQNSIAIVNEETGFVELSTTIGGSHLLHTLNVPIDDPYLMAKAVTAWKAKHKSLVLEFEGQELKDYNSLRNSFLETKINFPEDRWIVNISFFSKGWLSFSSNKNVSAEIVDVQKRFATVFEQTYTRFLDLQKAEAQAREAQIEAALERVRSRTMAMQNSDELAELVATVFTELNRLEFALTSCIIWINNPELLTAEMWVASTELNKPPEPYYIKPFRHPYFKSVIDAFKEKNKKWVYEMNGEEKKIFQEQFFNEVGSFPTLTKKALEAPESVVYSASFYNFGALEIVGTGHLTDEKFEILHRLGKVFDMSYTRFNDLKQAEAQAREARIETALERVRSRTLAMQKSDELAETAAVLFRQLIDLGIAPNRLYIGIINDDTGDIEAWATDEEGGKINNRFTLSSKRNASVKKMYDAWKHQQKSITIDMQGEELTNYITYLLGELHVPVTVGHTQQRRVQNIAYFGKGFIGIASPDPQPEETIQLIERFAAVFNLTYTRFNDLKVAEAHAIQAEEDLIKLQTEKKRAEDALTELRTTQAQLIQSEKMASLGELTAGIAHEIQNPLNFVNNFSEVNTELIAEMKEEIDKGNIEEVKAIANDISDNEQKINHHGKRADAIVKGMLQHSRSSSATKEPTDINKLADEYLRLAYHGLRAKDKTFNATLKTDYDDSIGYLNIVPQDIGRVILNLITNAFYVINEKKIQQPNGYEPTISVSTKKINNIVALTVTDNGNGIPQKVLDKIFQPFFTTKPTGEGTGLGLSLSYDIIKAHGGEIKVETSEGEGSEFIIQLPVV